MTDAIPSDLRLAEPTHPSRRQRWIRRLRLVGIWLAGLVPGLLAPTLFSSCAGLTVPDSRLTDTAVAQRPAPAAGEVTVLGDLVFHRPEPDDETTFEPLALDLYLPPDSIARPLPVVVGFHGGGFIEGSKDDYARFAHDLASRGIAVAAASYRLYQVARWPACMEDARAAVAWVRANASEYGFDPDRIGAMGRSAGGYLAMMLGAVTGRGGDAASAVCAVVNEAGPSDLDPMLWDGDWRGGVMMHFFFGDDGDGGQAFPTVSPARLVTDHTPPTLLLHGGRDGTVPYTQSRLMELAMRHADRPVRLVPFPGAGHDPLNGGNFDRGMNEVHAWLVQYLVNVNAAD